MTATFDELKTHLTHVADTQDKLVGLVKIAVDGNAAQTVMIDDLKKQLSDAVSGNTPPDVTDVIAKLDAISAQGDAMVAALTPPVTTPPVAGMVTDPTSVTNPVPAKPDAPMVSPPSNFVTPEAPPVEPMVEGPMVPPASSFVSPPVVTEAGVMTDPSNTPAMPTPAAPGVKQDRSS